MDIPDSPHDLLSPHRNPSPDDDDNIDYDMAAVAVALPPAITTTPVAAASAGVNKRYRPAPAKTFQCRGYGECRMVFSRSEHLARHIRKHTGERPFTCHCGKQFSRLDNLRQHAQTVHADKQDQNERMMHELTSLHASMTAATKGSQSRAKRAQASSASTATNGSVHIVKQEEPTHALPQSTSVPALALVTKVATASSTTRNKLARTDFGRRPPQCPSHQQSFLS
ncbi:hypothetical protein B0H21DRAFT_136540 [Amylocystis lapponica]|nr:hypothetical protein B0H21DRAFT_136540 [Amylocystis lapponica]